MNCSRICKTAANPTYGLKLFGSELFPLSRSKSESAQGEIPWFGNV